MCIVSDLLWTANAQRVRIMGYSSMSHTSWWSAQNDRTYITCTHQQDKYDRSYTRYKRYHHSSIAYKAKYDMIKHMIIEVSLTHIDRKYQDSTQKYQPNSKRDKRSKNTLS